MSKSTMSACLIVCLITLHVAPKLFQPRSWRARIHSRTLFASTPFPFPVHVPETTTSHLISQNGCSIRRQQCFLVLSPVIATAVCFLVFSAMHFCCSLGMLIVLATLNLQASATLDKRLDRSGLYKLVTVPLRLSRSNPQAHTNPVPAPRNPSP